jgi:hypothetical protein
MIAWLEAERIDRIAAYLRQVEGGTKGGKRSKGGGRPKNKPEMERRARARERTEESVSSEPFDQAQNSASRSDDGPEEAGGGEASCHEDSSDKASDGSGGSVSAVDAEAERAARILRGLHGMSERDGAR